MIWEVLLRRMCKCSFISRGGGGGGGGDDELCGTE
jgi:hypothetical protein